MKPRPSIVVESAETGTRFKFGKLARITEFVTGLIEKIGETPGDSYREEVDPLDFELRMIRRAVGPPLRPLLKSFGINMPETREEMDQLMGMLV